MRFWKPVTAIAIILACVLAACIVVGPSQTSGGEAGDAGGGDATMADAELDGGTTGSDGAEGGDAAPPTYGNVADASLWQAFDLSTVSADANGFWGAAFDGRYLYFVPTPTTRP